MKRFSFKHQFMSSLALTALVVSSPAYAAGAGGGGGLQFWNSPLTVLKQSLTGEVPFAIGTIAFAVAFLTLVWAHDLGNIAKISCYICMAVGGAMAAPTAMAQLQIAGAMIG
jgi:hypothetical protein